MLIEHDPEMEATPVSSAETHSHTRYYGIATERARDSCAYALAFASAMRFLLRT